MEEDIHLSVYSKQKNPSNPIYQKPELWLSSGAESDQVVSSSTSEGTRGVVISVAVSSRASVLELPRVIRGRASLRRGVSSLAAKLIRFERRARAFTRHNVPTVDDAKLVRTNRVEVGDAARVLAVSGSSLGLDPHLDVVTVDEAQVVEIFAGVALDCELSQS